MYRRAYGNKESDPLTLGETSPLELFKLGSKHRLNWTGFWFKYCRKDEWFKGVSVNQESPRVHAGECQMFKDIEAVRGAGRNPDLLGKLRKEQVELLPGCTLAVAIENLALNRYCFRASLPVGNPVALPTGGKITK